MSKSVLTKDKDIQKPFTEVLSKLHMDSPSHIHKILPSSIIEESNVIIACDNIELSPNYAAKENLIATLYEDFFAEYLTKYGEVEHIRRDKVVVGMGYTDTMTNLPQEPNTYVPLAPVSYSDKTGHNVLVLRPKKTKELQKTIIEGERPRSSYNFKSEIAGIGPLTFQDALTVAFIEGKAYESNSSLMTYLHNMENGLIAKDITNAHKNRPNLSVKYVDEQKKVRGYLLAYEGVHDDTNQPVIYVSDIASDLTTRGIGGKLMMGFLEQYRKEYVEKNKLLPIYAEMREGTSYDMVQKKLEDINTYLGVKLEMREVGSETKNGSIMHHVYLQVKKEE